MRRVSPLILALVLFSGCSTVNDALVRQWFKDSSMSRRLRHQIRDGLERREEVPPVRGPGQPAPAFMDQG